MGDERVQGLAVLRGGAAGGAKIGAHDKRHVQLAARHVMRLGRLIAKLVHDEKDEIPEHQVHHRARAGERGPDGHPHETRLGNRGVDDPVGAEFRL